MSMDFFKKDELKKLPKEYLPEGYNTDVSSFKPSANEQEILDYLMNAWRNNTTVSGLAVRLDNEKNMHVYFGGNTYGVIEASEFSYMSPSDVVFPKFISSKVAQVLECKVKKVFKVDGGYEITLSRKQAEEEARNYYSKNLTEGVIVKGIVRTISEVGAFVDIGGGFVGFLFVKDISKSRINHPSEKLVEGDKIDVIVKKFEKDTNKVYFTRKELFSDVFDYYAGLYQQGQTVMGIVKNPYMTGIFIEIGEGLEVLADRPTARRLEYNERVKVFIKKIDTEKRHFKIDIKL